MPAIWNVNKGYEVNNKKVSSKLTFEVGEKFNGRIVDKGEGNEVLVKLSDGWQFTAEVDGEFNLENQGLIKFTVEGFENGKLKLKIVQAEQKGSTVTGDSLVNLMEKEGLPQGDMELLLSMTKHNIPLTRENIGYIKSIIQFSEKMNQSPEEINDFINKFISGKGIDPQSNEAKELQTVLKDFFNSFKKMTSEDILLFLENDVELNKENIESYNKLFKGDNTIKEYFDAVGKEITILKEELPVTQNIKEKTIKDPNYKMESVAKADNNINYTKASVNDSQIASKAYDSNETVKGKISIMTLLKSMMKTDTALIKEPLKNILAGRASSFNFTNYNEALLKLESVTDSTILEMVKGNSTNQIEFTKNTLNKVVSNFFNMEMDLSDSEFEQTMNIVRLILEDNVEENSLVGSKTQNNTSYDFTSKIAEPQVISNSLAYTSDAEKLDIVDKGGTKLQQEVTLKGDLKTLEQAIINEDSELGEKPNQKIDMYVEEKTDLKADAKIQGKELQKDGQLINKGNLNQEITSEVGRNKGEEVQTKAQNDSLNEGTKIKLKSIDEVNLRTLLEKGERINSKDLIKTDIKVKLDDMKDIIKELIKLSENETLKNSKAMELIRTNINDFKLFNSISNEYYYLDIPIKQNNNEYPCKLIIKDNRKDDKKIDGSNIKMVVSVKTINIGNIDGYLKVRDSNLDIDLKCDEEYMKIIELGKEKLINGLKTLGFFVNVIVTQKSKEVDITTCRDFFDNSNTKAIDIKV